MKRLGKKLALPAVAGALLGLAVPGSASAQGWGDSGSIDFSSSVGASCVGIAWGANAQCAFVEFRLDVTPDIWVAIWNVFLENPADASSVPNTWSALPLGAGVVSLEDAVGTDLLSNGWSAGAVNGGIEVISGVNPLDPLASRKAEPLTMVVAMANFGYGGDLQFMTFAGQGNTVADGSGSQVSFGGFVAPEPASIALLATGLLGLGFMARRREEEIEG